jgi:hypothetical protein
MADVELFIEVREFAPGILEEETTPDGERNAKEIQKENRQKDENVRSISVVQDCLVAGHEFQLVEEPKSIAQQDDDGEQQGVRDHRESLGFAERFRASALRFRERAESGPNRRPSCGAPVVLVARTRKLG